MVLEPWSVTRSCSSVHGWDDDVSSAVSRERQRWNEMTHLLTCDWRVKIAQPVTP